VTLQERIYAACDPSTGGGGGVVSVSGINLLSEGLIFPGNDNPNLNAQVTLQGDGINSTVIYTNTPNLDLVTIARNNVKLRGIYFQGSQQQQGTGRGIVISNPVNGKVVTNTSMEDCYVAATEREALYAPDGFPHLLAQPAYDRISVIASYLRCWFDSNLTPGSDLAYIGQWNTHHRFTECQFVNFKGRALYLNGCDSTSCRDCNFEAGDNSKPYVEGRGALSTLLDHCRFEDHAITSPLATFTVHDRASKGWVERDLIKARASA
jgi:hypothetical protein